MRSICFIPLAFLAGAHGFAMLAPYMLIVMAADLLRRRGREVRDQKSEVGGQKLQRTLDL